MALVPDAVKKLADAGFEVVVERGAGDEANLTDAAYEEGGATIGARPTLGRRRDREGRRRRRATSRMLSRATC